MKINWDFVGGFLCCVLAMFLFYFVIYVFH